MKRFLILSAAMTLALTAVPGDVHAGPKGCPPGLAKKSPACVPPGQAKKGVTAEDWAERRGADYEPGDRIDDDHYDRLSDGDRIIIDGREYIVVQTARGPVLRRGDDRYRLPRYDDGSEYVRIGDAILRINRETQQVIELMRLADLVLG
ncbi:hypothetical protein GQ651_04360 [Alphaproteobacteria bacterium GH1-50]|uniref:Nickel/cobalt transporter regulator n=1 Tax=Kangsaoukella pontilimi TaxID=2691042 RepID=A0A7C9MCF8_9RHOB|nr:hypothetical protein [Kangsaoukella pontilimi]MXQ07072.1 hypothetical protein [Kangsaoukella pontilimi]